MIRMDMITVYVTEHDDPEVTFVVNTKEDMRQNFDEMIDDSNPGEGILIRWPGDAEDEGTTYDASRLLRLADPVTYDIRFGYYLDTWTEVDMPLDLFLSDNETEKIAFVAQAVGSI